MIYFLIPILLIVFILNKKSKNNFFYQSEIVIYEKLDLIFRILKDYDLDLKDKWLLEEAFIYFIENPSHYNGTSVVNDFWLIKGLEPESVIHDYNWIMAKSLNDFLISNKEYCKRLRNRNANFVWVWVFIFIGLTIVSLFKSIKFIKH
jgi:hypothetical protein